MKIFSLTLLIVFTILSLYAYIPQIIKLIRTKSSRDISLSSWIIWIISDICYLLYAIIESSSAGIIFMASVELAFVIIISILILIYRSKIQRNKS
jgi:uncharacterized protein with PQ loop repeat